jgi:CheY-like chemotaxis protein
MQEQTFLSQDDVFWHHLQYVIQRTSMTAPDPCCLRLLVADDEYAIAFSLARILRLVGFECEYVLSGKDAVKAAGRFRPDIFISDYAMPGMNGLEAAVEISNLLPGCRTILLSGHELSVHYARYAIQGYNFLLLSKPVEPDVLIDILRHGTAGAPVTAKHPRVLHVDDVEYHRYSVSRMLVHAGFDVTGAATGGEALARATANPPDVVLLDINLPDMDGFDVCRKLKELKETARVMVVHLTATCRTPEARSRSRIVGAEDFFTEPFASAQLISRLRSLVQAKLLAGSI